MATRITDHPTLGEFASFNDGGLSSGDTTNADARIFAQSADDEICITGLSGSFPNSRNVAEFEHNLWNKVNMRVYICVSNAHKDFFAFRRSDAQSNEWLNH